MCLNNNDKLKYIEEYSALFFSPADIAILIDENIDDFIDKIADKSSPESKAYYKAKLIAKSEVRKQILKLAKHGSPQAEDLVIKFISQQDFADNNL
jgi:hypothetical protein